jgi:hypothetical protein
MTVDGTSAWLTISPERADSPATGAGVVAGPPQLAVPPGPVAPPLPGAVAPPPGRVGTVGMGLSGIGGEVVVVDEGGEKGRVMDGDALAARLERPPRA